MNLESIGFLGAFIGGLLSFFSPCTLPILPSLVTFLENEDPAKAGRMSIQKMIAFWLGFTVVFLAMGSIASSIGAFFFEYRPLIVKFGGIFVILMGLFLLGLGARSALQKEYRPFLGGRFQGIGGAFLFGIAFTAGWTPCSGPILAAILTVAGNNDDPTIGMALLGAYAVGFGVPFLILTFFFDALFYRIRGIYRFLPLIQKISGVLLVILGIMIYLDKLSVWILKLAS